MKRSIDCATSGKLLAKPLAVESARHRLVVLGGDVHDARDVADPAVVVRAVDHRNELVGGVLDVLVVLAELVAVVLLAVEERDDEGVLEPDLERVRAVVRLTGPGHHQVISKQRLAAGAVDQDVSRLEHRHRVLRADDRGRALDRRRLPPVDQIAELALDGVERAEAEPPSAEERHQVRRNGLSEGDALADLRRVEDGLDAVSVDRIGPVGLDACRRRGTARAGPSGCACTRAASRRDARRAPPSTGVAR